jgi:catechol 2,3-dioxygenase-like lactoylglutathione lyase family enzyme
MTAAQAPRLSHIGICVADIEASVKFYCGALGYVRAECYEIAAGLDTIMELSDVNVTSQFIRRSDGSAIELLKLHTPTAVGPRERRALNQFGITHVSFYVDNLERAAEAVQLHGGTIHSHTLTELPGIRLLFCSDPDGVRVELMQTIPTSVS